MDIPRIRALDRQRDRHSHLYSRGLRRPPMRLRVHRVLLPEVRSLSVRRQRLLPICICICRHSFRQTHVCQHGCR